MPEATGKYANAANTKGTAMINRLMLAYWRWRKQWHQREADYWLDLYAAAPELARVTSAKPSARGSKRRNFAILLEGKSMECELSWTLFAFGVLTGVTVSVVAALVIAVTSGANRW
jgi:hypothetical protein